MRNSTAEFLIFTAAAGEESIEVRYEDKTIWLSQKMMAALFDVSIPTINFHLKKIYESGGTNFLNYQVNCKKTVRGITPSPHLFSF